MFPGVHKINNDADTRAKYQQKEQPAIAVKIDQHRKRISRLISGFVRQFNIIFAAFRQHIFSADPLTVMIDRNIRSILCIRNIHRPLSLSVLHIFQRKYRPCKICLYKKLVGYIGFYAAIVDIIFALLGELNIIFLKGDRDFIQGSLCKFKACRQSITGDGVAKLRHDGK